MRETIASLQKQVQAAEAKTDEVIIKAGAERAAFKDVIAKSDRRNSDLAQQLDKRREDIAALKAELFAAHQVIARQAGYIDRALEDDSMRELGPIKEERPAAQETSRRAPPPTAIGIGIGAGDYEYRMIQRSGPPPWHDR